MPRERDLEQLSAPRPPAATVAAPLREQPGARIRALQRAAGNRAAGRLLQRDAQVLALPPAQIGDQTYMPPELSLLERPGYVFLMEDPATAAVFGFARKYYERYRPNATIVTDKRTLGDVLDSIAAIPSAAGETTSSATAPRTARCSSARRPATRRARRRSRSSRRRSMPAS